MKDNGFRAVLAAFALTALSGCQPIFFTIGLGSATHLERAEALSSDGRYEEAIEEYRMHIDHRLALENRPDWENPYLYYLIIGDLELNRGRPEEALRAYEAAESRGVDAPLVSDRYRYAASWFERRGELERALEKIGRAHV